MSRSTVTVVGETSRLSRIRPLFWWLLAFTPLAVKLALCLYHLKVSWDDAAITAAFSRTWAETGKIALTPVSHIVEGFSSVTWFLLLSIPYFFTNNPNAGLVWMKLLSAFFLLLSLRLLYVIAMRQFANRSAAIVAVLLFAYCYASDREMEDGMEMTLASFLLLLLFHVLTGDRQRWRLFYVSIVSFLLMLTRFEAPFMLMLLFGGVFYAAFRGWPDAMPKRDIFKISAAVVAGFVLIEIWRYHVFGVWMPNTVYAKRFVPYSDWSTPTKFLQTRLVAMEEPIIVLCVPLIFAAYLAIQAFGFRRSKWRWLREFHPAVWLLAFGCFLFGAIFGHNWGHTGRMVTPMLPFLILVIVGICVSAVPDKRMLARLFVVLLIGQGLVWLEQDAIYPVGYGSMESVEPLGIGADSVRAALHKQKITVMMPDIGASSLCCERLNVIDIGMLADSTLSHTAWKGFDSYFRKVDPDVVEIGSVWAAVSHIYDTGLLNDYSIVTSDGVRYFVRDDLYNRLITAHAGPILPVTAVPACLTGPAWNWTEDNQFSLGKRTCLVLDRP